MSKTGVHVVPPFSVFHTLPEPTATYQTSRSFGWIAMSAMRPDMMAGPMLRKASPDSAASVSALLAVSAFGTEGLAGAWAFWAGSAAVSDASRTITMKDIRFTEPLFVEQISAR